MRSPICRGMRWLTDCLLKLRNDCGVLNVRMAICQRATCAHNGVLTMCYAPLAYSVIALCRTAFARAFRWRFRIFVMASSMPRGT